MQRDFALARKWILCRRLFTCHKGNNNNSRNNNNNIRNNNDRVERCSWIGYAACRYTKLDADTRTQINRTLLTVLIYYMTHTDTHTYTHTHAKLYTLTCSWQSCILSIRMVSIRRVALLQICVFEMSFGYLSVATGIK